MKKLLMLFTAVVLMAVFAATGMAQTSASTTTDAGAKLIVPMMIYQDAPLHFGTINLLLGVAGTCVLPSNNTIRAFSGGIIGSSVAPLPTNAAYHVTGTMNSTYALTLPSTITVTETVGNSATMTINTIKARFNGQLTDGVTSTLSATGTDSFTLGGTLIVAAAQVAGIYHGTFTLSVDYN
jgi:hypothetical protein